MTEKLPGPLYRTWDEAMADPDLDLSKPWFVADPDAPSVVAPATVNWSGWTELGYTDDGGTVYYRPAADGEPPR